MISTEREENGNRIKVCVPAVFIMHKRFKKCYTVLKNLFLAGELNLPSELTTSSRGIIESCF